jgi:hypothetical protein
MNSVKVKLGLKRICNMCGEDFRTTEQARQWTCEPCTVNPMRATVLAKQREQELDAEEERS